MEETNIHPDTFSLVITQLIAANFLKKKKLKKNEYLEICSKIWENTDYVNKKGLIEEIHFSFVKHIDDFIKEKTKKMKKNNGR